MKKLMIYCQHILGIGHLIRSMEIARGLAGIFDVYLVDGGQPIPGFQVPDSVSVIRIPAIKTDSEFSELQVIDGQLTLEAAQALRKKLLLAAVEDVGPDVLIIELFPFGRHQFSSELIPMIEAARALGARVVCSLRDIIVTRENRARHESGICELMNKSATETSTLRTSMPSCS